MSFDQKFSRLPYHVLSQTGESEWPWVFTAGLTDAYPGAFMGCQDELDAARLLHAEGVLLAPIVPRWIGRRLRPVEKARLAVFAALHEEICDADDDFFAVRFATRTRATAFLDRFNAYLERKLNPWCAQAAERNLDVGEEELRLALQQAGSGSAVEAAEDGRLALWLDELLRRRGAWDEQRDMWPQFDGKPSTEELADRENDLI